MGVAFQESETASVAGCFLWVQLQAAAALQQWAPSTFAASPVAARQPTDFTSISRCSSSFTQQLRAASNSARQGPVQQQQPTFSFDECTDEVLLCAAPSTTQEQRKAAIAELAACRNLVGEGWWMLVECGTWRHDAAPPAGPAGTAARAVLCFSHGSGTRDFDARAFVLDQDGLPTGEMYVDSRGMASVTAFEQRTSKKTAKKYRISCIIVRNGRPAWATERGMLSVHRFLVEKFGEDSVRRRPNPAAAAAAAAVKAGDSALLLPAGSAAAGSRRRSKPSAAAAAGTTAAGKACTAGSSAPSTAASSSRRRRQQHPVGGGAAAA